MNPKSSRPIRLRASAALVLATLPLLVFPACAVEPGFQSLFNGRDLSGWEGNPEFWSVRDGAITGQTTPEKVLKGNTFLIWKGGQPANFELRISFKLTAQNEQGRANSGVQVRSRILNQETFSVGGYQADFASTPTYTGMLYEERGRGVFMAPGQKVRLTPSAESTAARKKSRTEVLATLFPVADIQRICRFGDWNDMVIVARGNRFQISLNGTVTADVVDDDPVLGAKAGIIALQLHQGPPMTVQFKNIQLKVLP